MTNLKEVNFGLNQYCGPAVLSALTGKSTDECAAVISAVSGRQEIRAVAVAHLIEAFRRLQFDMKAIDQSGYTLFANLSSLSTKQGMYIILVPKHVVAVEVTEDKHLYLVDNHSKSPIPAESSARLSQRCEAVYKITERPKPKFMRTEIVVEKRIYGNHILIRATDIYDIVDANMTMNYGQFNFRNDAELDIIIDKLIEYRSKS